MAVALAGCTGQERASVCIGEPDLDLWISGLDGMVTQLTDLPGAEAFPDWSPDGTRIAFVASQEGNCDIYVKEVAGSEPINLTTSDVDELHPSWSPDGNEIVFSSEGQLHGIEVASGERRQITDSDLIHNFPDWSPGGGAIVFSGGVEPAGPGAIHDVYIVPVVGGEEVAVTDARRLLVGPRWSPDGGRIAYFDHTDSLSVWTMSADGSNTQLIGPGGHVSWSPDGGDLVHDLEVATGDVDLYITQLSDSGVMLLVDGPGVDTTPVWSPGGEMIIFASDR